MNYSEILLIRCWKNPINLCNLWSLIEVKSLFSFLISLFSFLFFRVFLKLSHVLGFHCSAPLLPFLYTGRFFSVLLLLLF